MEATLFICKIWLEQRLYVYHPRDWISAPLAVDSAAADSHGHSNKFSSALFIRRHISTWAEATLLPSLSVVPVKVSLTI